MSDIGQAIEKMVDERVEALRAGMMPREEVRVPLPVWARRKEVIRLTGLPEGTLYKWMADGRVSFRKTDAAAKQSATLYRVSDVLREIEAMGGRDRAAS